MLRDIHDFLVSHPDEVIAIVNQDHVTPADMVRAVRDAGLEPFAYRGRVDGARPTLREMIDSGQRLVLSPRAAPARRRGTGWPTTRRCRREHVAVNFYRPGDVFRVVDELNAVGGG